LKDRDFFSQEWSTSSTVQPAFYPMDRVGSSPHIKQPEHEAITFHLVSNLGMRGAIHPLPHSLLAWFLSTGRTRSFNIKSI